MILGLPHLGSCYYSLYTNHLDPKGPQNQRFVYIGKYFQLYLISTNTEYMKLYRGQYKKLDNAINDSKWALRSLLEIRHKIATVGRTFFLSNTIKAICISWWNHPNCLAMGNVTLLKLHFSVIIRCWHLHIGDIKNTQMSQVLDHNPTGLPTWLFFFSEQH